MRRLLILGAGTAGTIAANKLRRRLSTRDWNITLVDRNRTHLHRQGLGLLPFGAHNSESVLTPQEDRLHSGVRFVQADVDGLAPHERHVTVTGGRRLDYDYLVIATGAQPRPDRTPGMLGSQWHRSVHEFTSVTGAIALRSALHRFARNGGRLVVHIAGLPVLHAADGVEFVLRADAYLRVTTAATGRS